MVKSVVRSDLKKSTRELLTTISNFPEEYFNTHAKEGRWTAGQIAEHLIKVETGTVHFFTGETEPTDRDPLQKISKVKERLLNDDLRMNANEPIIPDDKPKDKESVLKKLQDIRQRLISLVEIEDLTELISSFAHPLFGPMTRVEWIYFNILHSRRHIRQSRDLEKIFSEK